jgi:peptidoglycan hydrolase-like protein with peptidoglycan-binding domain
MMIKVSFGLIFVLIAFSSINAGQVSNQKPQESTNKSVRKLSPIIRPDIDQVKKAQKVLKDRSFYFGEISGRLDKPTREAIKEFQSAENMTVTGTLNIPTLVKMKIPLTDKQKSRL